MKHFTVYETLSQITSDLHVSFVAWVTEGSTLDPERVRRLPAQAGSSGPRGTLSAGGCHLGCWLRELIHLPFSLPPPESWVCTERPAGMGGSRGCLGQLLRARERKTPLRRPASAKIQVPVRCGRSAPSSRKTPRREQTCPVGVIFFD